MGAKAKLNNSIGTNNNISFVAQKALSGLTL